MKPAQVLRFLETLSLFSTKQRNAVLRKLSREQLKTLEEACYNLLKNPQGLNGVHLAWARSKKRTLRKLADKQITKKSKQKILTQKGGFLSALLPVLVSLVSSFVQ
jgi:hypothetical protein